MEVSLLIFLETIQSNGAILIRVDKDDPMIQSYTGPSGRPVEINTRFEDITPTVAGYWLDDLGLSHLRDGIIGNQE